MKAQLIATELVERDKLVNIFLYRISFFKTLSLFFVLFALIGFTFSVHAQDAKQAFGETAEVSVYGEQVESGKIVALNGNDFMLSSEPHQNVLIGVVQDDTIFQAEPDELPEGARFSGEGNSKQVILSGVANVQVSGANGAIEIGDWLTSSEQSGIGMRAVDTGYVIGTAMEKAELDSKDDLATIRVSLNVHLLEPQRSVSSNFFDLFRLAALSVYEQPRQALRYLISLFLIFTAMVFVFTNVGKTARLGVIALGRNPLASKKIYRGMFLNFIFSIAYLLGASVAVYLILSF